ncbi:MAG TPA: endo-1,4-beta-xylanase [Phnomibacter sp.]|nr:endo-1,4-beta-xylanase [Phnomibacter sp.]
MRRILSWRILFAGTCWMFGVMGGNVLAQTYPPSCVVTMPYSNAYYKVGTDVMINVYATDFGKSTNNGTVQFVEFYQGDVLLGKSDRHSNYCYSFLWKKAPAGTYTVKAKAVNSAGVSFTSVGVIVTVGSVDVVPKGLSAGKGKYLANIYQRANPINYHNYWNGVTSENACKWGSVEAVRGTYQWQGADAAYGYAKEHNMMFRYHAGVWASQYPQWLLTLSTDSARLEIVRHLKVIAARFPLADQIDLLNEQLFKHQKDNQKFRELLGGPGTTESDYGWQIWLFEQGRKIFPNTKLVLNDYGLEGDTKAIKAQLELFKVLRDRGLVDGFGTQAHAFNVDKPAADTIKASIDLMATAGLPIFVTELDMNGGIKGRQANDTLQLASFQKAFPVFWEHPAIAGITLWGYVSGTTWMAGTGIVSKDGVENPSMLWLKEYMNSRPLVGYPMGELVKGKPKLNKN